MAGTSPLEPPRAPEPEADERVIRIRADSPAGACYPFWDVANCNSPHTILRPGFPARTRMVAPLVKALNLVYLLGGRYEKENAWFLGVNADGTVRADFSGMVAELRKVLDNGYTPRIVLDNVPYEMSDPPRQNFYGNTAPPGDERVWHRYVRAAVGAMVDAFGRETVGGWSFRVGTEPDLNPGHWSGTREQFLAHYDYTVDAVTRILPDVEIGPGNILNPGPGASSLELSSRWGLDIIDHAAVGANACTGARGTRMCFFTCSWYGRVGGSLAAFDATVEIMRSRLGRYPQFADLPIDIGESSVLSDENGRRLVFGDTTEWSASFYAALADRVYAHGIRKVYEWQHATLGVLHPRGHVIAMLRRMEGSRRLAVDAESPADAPCGAIASRREDGSLLLLVYNHHALRRPTAPLTVRLRLLDARMKRGQTWRLSEWAIDSEHAVWAYAFDADAAAAGITALPEAGRFEGLITRLYGQPGEDLFRRNIEKYRRLSALPRTRAGAPLAVLDGGASLDLVLPGHSVRLLEVSPPAGQARPGKR